LYGGKPDDIIKLSDLAFHNAISKALPQLHICKSLTVSPSAKPQEKLSHGGTLLLNSEQHTVTSSQLPTSQAAMVSKSDVDNLLRADQLNVELKLPDSKPPKTDATTHKDDRLDLTATVVSKFFGDNPHLIKLFVEKLANKPPMRFLMNHQL
jgi:hypothetical protein